MARILLLLSRKQSDLLPRLKELLVKEGHDVAVGDPEAVPEYDFDLCVTDAPALAWLKTKIKETERGASPVLLPFLLIASRRDVDIIDPSLLHTIDEIIFLPIAESELRTRVRGLLRARMATTELQESKLEMMQEMPVGILLLRRGLIIYANPAFCELCGRSFSNLKETELLHLVHPNDRPQAALFLDNVMAGKNSKPVLMLRLLTPKDSLWIELHLSAFSHDGIPGALAAVVEITDRIAREESLEAALEFADDIVQTVREPMVVLDSELRVISANQSFYRTFRIAAPEACGKLLYELGDRQWDIPQLKSLLTRILAEQSTMEDFEIEHHFPSVGHRAML
ncbi:MAG: PAS domain-containing protein, partial [Desulforhabdus sp.]|nr:PAS domain-containing protein [Desulforhabdus sp.]